MKNFLKSMALFACTVLLFGACSEETTEDVASTVVAIPTITEATPGDGTIAVEWSIPSICDADQSIVSWYLDGVMVDSYTEEGVEAGGAYDYYIEGLTAGSYTVKIANYVSTTGDTSEYAEKVVEVYDESSYAAKLPVPASYTFELIYSTSGTVTITWDTFDADCTAVKVYYGTDFNTTKDVTIESGSTTILQNVSSGSGVEFMYQATFCPEGSSESISVWSEVLSLGSTVSTPTAVSTKSGNERFEISWTLDADELSSIEKMLVTYGDNSYYITEEFVAGENSAYVPDVIAGDYEVTLSSVTFSGFVSDAATVDGDVWVYDSESFSYPVVSEIINENGTVTLIAAASENITSWVVQYTDGSGVTQIEVTPESDGSYAMVLPGAVTATAVFNYSATFLPEGAIADDVVTFEFDAEEGNIGAVPASTQYTPVITSVSTTNDGSITVNWDIESPYDISESVINIYTGGELFKSISDTQIAETGNTKTLTIADDDLKAGTTYSVTIQTLSTLESQGLSAESVSVEGIFSYIDSTFTTSYYPSATASFSDGVVSVAWSGVGYVQSLVVTYNDVDYAFTLTSGTLVGESFRYVAGVSTFTFKDVVFLPTYADTPVTVATTSSTVTIAAPTPATPDAPVVTTGYTADGSYLLVAWSVDATYAAEGSYSTVYYKTADAEEWSTTKVYVTSTSCTSPKLSVAADESYEVMVDFTSQYGVSSSTSASTSVKTYDASSYTTAPAIESVALIEGADGVVNAEITWATFEGADLSSVEFAYGTNLTSSAVVTEGVLEAVTTLEGVSTGGAYQYTAKFLPADGIESVDIVVDALTFPSAATPELIGVVVSYDAESGLSGFNVSWDMSSLIGVSSVGISYYDGDTLVGTATATLSTGETTVVSSADIAADKAYTIYVYSVNASGVEQLCATPITVTTYGASTYSTNPVAVTSIATANDIVSVAWDVTAVPSGADYYVDYTCGSASVAGLTSFDAAAEIPYVYGSTNTFAYTTYIKPSADCAGYVAVASTVAVPEQTPDAPTALSVISGYDSAANGKGSYITLSWTNGGVDDIAKYIIHYTVGDDAEQTAELAIDTTTAQTSYTLENLTTLGDYTIYVTTQTAAGTSSVNSAEVTATAYGATTYADSTVPTLAAALNGDDVNLTWTNIDADDLYSVTYSYGAVEGYQDVEVLVAALSSTISIPYVSGQATVTFTAQYKPTMGVESISKDGVSVVFGTQAPDAPIDVAVTALSYSGENSIATITWDYPSSPTSTTAVAAYSVYALAADSDVKVGETTTTDKTNTFTTLAADTEYTFYVASQDNSATPVTSAYVSSTAVETYGLSSYGSDDLPSCAVAYEEGTVTLTWGITNSDIQSLTVTYGGVAQTPITTFSGTVTSTFNYVEASGEDFTYEATFKPTISGVTTIDVVTVTGGSGTFVASDYDIIYADNIYEIYTGAGLKAFADIVNGTSATSETLKVKGMTLPVSQNLAADAKLAATNIDLSTICGDGEDGTADADWTPMASYASQYSGTFDGDGNSISGLYINASSTSYCSLFAGTSGTIKNLTIVSPTIVGNTNNAAVTGYLAATGVVENCHVTGGQITIGTTTTANSGIFAGHSLGKVYNCTSSCSILSGGGRSFAGIVGNNAGYIIGCHVLEGASVSSLSYGFGGVAGTNTGYIIGSSFAGYVGSADLTTSCGGTSGGLVGYGTSGYIIGCYNTGALTATDTGNKAAIAGLVGNNTAAISLYGCYSTATLTLSGTDAARRGYISGGDGTGGDGNYSTYQSCYYVATCETLTLKGDCEFSDSEGIIESAADAATIGGKYSEMNTGIAAGIAAMEAATSTSFGYTVSYTESSTGAPTVTVTAK